MSEKVTLRDFLLHKTKVMELCVIRESRWIVAACWIDHEDLFRIPPDLEDKFVKGDSWGTIPITTENGFKARVSCHYIDV